MNNSGKDTLGKGKACIRHTGEEEYYIFWEPQWSPFGQSTVSKGKCWEIKLEGDVPKCVTWTLRTLTLSLGKKKKIPYPNNSEKHCVVLSTSGKIDSEQNPSLPFPQYSWNPALLETVNRVMRRVQNNPESSDEP